VRGLGKGREGKEGRAKRRGNDEMEGREGTVVVRLARGSSVGVCWMAR